MKKLSTGKKQSQTKGRASERKMKKADDIIRRYSNTLRALAR